MKPPDQLSQVVDLTLLANFLHQVINPLNGVCGTIDNITDGEVPPGSVTQRLRASRAQLEHCVSLIRNLAFFSEFARDPDAYRERHKGKLCVMPRTIIEAMMFFQESARRKRMQIHLVDRETQYKIEADPDLIRQIFMNLLDNAVKYGDQGTDIFVKSHIQKKTSELIVEVSSRSPPLPESLWDKIFEAGYRGENARQIVASGTGLGLYICRLIADVYHGSIKFEVRGNPPQATFVLRFPKASL